MPDFPCHRSVRLQNFTVFRDATFEFVPGINVLVGGNGTGKTHLMKAMFAFQLAADRDPSSLYTPLMIAPRSSVLQVMQASSFKELVRFGSAPGALVRVGGAYGDSEWYFQFQGEIWEHSNPVPVMSRPAFIPASDVTAHTKGFVTTYEEFEIDFDRIWRDMASLMLGPNLRKPNTETHGRIEELLKDTLGGDVEESNERLFLVTAEHRIPMPLVGEGLRKIATLYQLVRNGWLRPGATLFWDEPEVNLNPTLMDEVVSCLLGLAHTGVQIFLATHDYVILSELDLQSKRQGLIRYFALDATENGTTVNPTDDVSQLSPNLISNQFDRLYDLTLTRATGRSRSR